VDPFTPRLAWVSGITCFPYTPDRLWIEPGIRVLASTKNPVGLKVCTETPSTRFSDRPSHALCVPGGRFVSSGLRYAARSGIEGTHAQAISRCGLRRCRYIGLAKTSLQHVITAAAVNFVRIADWYGGIPAATTRCSRFAALQMAA
jgi:hypothetical protein